MSVSDLPAALARWAAARPEAPWLFHPAGLDWRWLSWSEGAAEVVRLAAAARAALEAAGLAPPAAVCFVYEPRPARVLLDLAVQAAGYTAAPRLPSEPARHPEVLLPGEDPPPDAAVAWVRLEDSSHLAAGPAVPAGVEVRAAEAPRTLTAAELATSAAALEAAVAAAAPLRRPEREILLAARDLADPAERRIHAWSLLQGAALLLEPSAPSRVPTAAWARPTVFHGGAGELGDLRREAEHHDREGFAGLLRRLGRPPRPDLPFRRLHTLFTHSFKGQQPWLERGVRLVDPERY